MVKVCVVVLWVGVVWCGGRFVVVVCGVCLRRRLCLQVVCVCCHGKKRYTDDLV